MTARALTPKVGAYCGWCGNANHRLCPGTCACADTGHTPGDALAASMRLYQDFTLTGDTVEHLAAEYRVMSTATS